MAITFSAQVTRFTAKVFMVNGKPTPGEQKKEAEYNISKTVYPGDNAEDVKNEFIAKAARDVRSNNVSEENKVIYHKLKTMQVWVITDLT